jgi:hypothetical protein
VIFEQPLHVDRTSTIKQKTPTGWKKVVSDAEIDVLPIVTDTRGTFESGWVSYEDTVLDSPDIEIFCGGVNDKSTIGAALWRQGHLLHFGFEQSPAQMNENGRAMLVNAIAYISHFGGDLAICRSRSPFAGGSPRARSSLEGWLKSEDYPIEFVTGYIAPELLSGVVKSRAAYLEWFTANRGWLRPGPKNQLVLDEDAKALGIAYDRPEMFDQALARLGEGKEPALRAGALLARYVPEGPGAAADAGAWREWLEENRPYLFYSEWSGYRWYVDPLAKERGIATGELSGRSRADR